MEGDVGIKKEGVSTEEKVKEINCSWKADRIGEVLIEYYQKIHLVSIFQDLNLNYLNIKF